jgi:hypothetical protein
MYNKIFRNSIKHYFDNCCLFSIFKMSKYLRKDKYTFMMLTLFIKTGLNLRKTCLLLRKKWFLKTLNLYIRIYR